MVILSFLAAILEINRSFAIPSYSIGFLDPENMGIDTRIMLLYTSEANLCAKNTVLGGHFEILAAILKRKVKDSYDCSH